MDYQVSLVTALFSGSIDSEKLKTFGDESSLVLAGLSKNLGGVIKSSKVGLWTFSKLFWCLQSLLFWSIINKKNILKQKFTIIIFRIVIFIVCYLMEFLRDNFYHPFREIQYFHLFWGNIYLTRTMVPGSMWKGLISIICIFFFIWIVCEKLS